MQPETSRERPEAAVYQCPVCGAEAVPGRSELRCVRCGFVLCVGCEGGVGSVEDADECVV
jgi:hypothetical protein